MKEEKKPALPVPQSSSKSPKKQQSYWESTANTYTLAVRLFLMVLILFLVLFMILCSRAFTYNSVFGFFKDVRAVSAFVSTEDRTVTSAYRGEEETAIAFRGGVAFADRAGLEVYAPDGACLLNLERAFVSPRLCASRKYLLVYDQGGVGFSVTNAYAELHRAESAAPILGAAVADSGHFALITAPIADVKNPDAPTPLSRVELYDSDFNLIQEFNRFSATVGVDVSDNGRRIALLGLTASEGREQSVLSIYHLSRTEPDVTLTFDDSLPLGVDYIDNRYLCVLTDKGVRFYHSNGELKEEHSLAGATLCHYLSDEWGIAAVTESDAVSEKYRIRCFDEKGRVLYDADFVGEIAAISRYRDVLFVLFGNTVMRIDLATAQATTIACVEGANALFAVDGRSVRVMYPAKAEYLRFE